MEGHFKKKLPIWTDGKMSKEQSRSKTKSSSILRQEKISSSLSKFILLLKTQERCFSCVCVAWVEAWRYRLVYPSILNTYFLSCWLYKLSRLAIFSTGRPAGWVWAPLLFPPFCWGAARSRKVFTRWSDCANDQQLKNHYYYYNYCWSYYRCHAAKMIIEGLLLFLSFSPFAELLLDGPAGGTRDVEEASAASVLTQPSSSSSSKLLLLCWR